MIFASSGRCEAFDGVRGRAAPDRVGAAQPALTAPPLVSVGRSAATADDDSRGGDQERG